MSVAPLISQIRDALRDEADPERAPGMQAYTKSVMPYRGVRLPLVRAITQGALATHPVLTLDEVETAVMTLWDEAVFREERYAASALTGHKLAVGRLEMIPIYQHLAATGAWWDHVDSIAGRIADLHDVRPVETAEVVQHWSRSDDRWLRRLAIISQLGRRDRVDTDLLARVIDANATDPDFFIRKAIGWALRDHARADPGWVRAFVEERTSTLSTLSRREALKHVG
jgi:3-methyladenine DNA glycosylase AlkD